MHRHPGAIDKCTVIPGPRVAEPGTSIGVLSLSGFGFFTSFSAEYGDPRLRGDDGGTCGMTVERAG